MGHLYTFFVCLFFVSNVFATTLVPLSLEGQLRDADAVVRGIYQGQESKKLSTGEIVTEGELVLSEYAGLNLSELYHKRMKVYFPGGVYHNRVVRVDSAPTFTQGEEVVLLLQKKSFGYLVQGLALGKYRVVKEEQNKEVYVSEAFPNHHELGRTSSKKFNQLVQAQFGSPLQKLSFVQVKTNSVSSEMREAHGRRPASFDTKMEQKNRDVMMSIFWIVGVFFGLGLLTIQLRKKGK